ncbi:MAG: hypothetical protein ACI92S_003641 [Planctomycetaceae bacterium]
MNQETSSNNTVDSEPLAVDQETVTPSSRRKMLLRLVVLVGAGLVLIIIGLPTIVATTGLHNVILGSAAQGRELSVTADSATLAWFAPVSLRNADVKRDDKSWEVSTETFSTDKTLLQLLLAPSDVGTINLDRPTVVLQPIDSSEKDGDDQPAKTKTLYPPLRAVVRDGAVELRTAENPEPVIALDGISFVGRTEVANETSVLIVEPVKLFDRRELTPELCDQGLQLIAPFLSDAAMVTGQLTVELDEFQIPIGTVTPEERVQMTRICGRMMLHRVETGLKNPLLAEIASVLATVSGGNFATVRASEETHVDFRVENGRVHHEGLTLLVPELASGLTIQTSGWVDLDENIDVRILIDLSDVISSRVAMLNSLTQAPLEIRMTGTLKKPRLSLPAGRDLLGRFAGGLGQLTGRDDSTVPGGKPNVAGAISDLVGGLVRGKDEKPDVNKTARGIFDLIGAIRDKVDDDKQSRPGTD